VTGRLPADGKQRVLLFLHATAFAFPVKLSLSQSRSLLACLLFSLLPAKEGSEQEAGWVFGCWPGLTP